MMGYLWEKVYPETPPYPEIAAKACMIVQEGVRLSDERYADDYPRTPACMAFRSIITAHAYGDHWSPDSPKYYNELLDDKLVELEILGDEPHEYWDDDYFDRVILFRYHSPDEEGKAYRAELLGSSLRQPEPCIVGMDVYDDCRCESCIPGLLKGFC